MKSPKSHRILKRVAALWTVVCAAYFMWEALNYRGVFGRLAELQIANFGAYVPLLTYLLLVALAIVPAFFILWAVTRKANKEATLASSVEAGLAQARRVREVLMVVGLTTACVALGFAVFSVWFLPSQNGKMQSIAVSDVGTVEIIEGPARLVGGELGTIIYFGQDWFIGDDRMAFAPYRSSASGDGVARVFIELDATDRTKLKSVEQRLAWSGIIVEGGLPGTARALFNYIGVGVASPYYTLYRTEYDLKLRYWLQSIQWGLLAVFIGLLVILQSRRIRRLEDYQVEGSALS